MLVKKIFFLVVYNNNINIDIIYNKMNKEYIKIIYFF